MRQVAKSSQPMVILDRDGVINYDSKDYITSAAEWVAITGSLEAIGRLKKAGYLVTVATNQSAIARGLLSPQGLAEIHQKMASQLALHHAQIDGIFYCPHGPDDHCLCRKPKPGMLMQIAREFNIDLSQTVFVGDSLSDLEAARMAGAKPVLLRSAGREIEQRKYSQISCSRVYDDLAHFVEVLLKEKIANV